MNMQVLKRSRTAQREGDIFTFKLRHRPFGFGRVIRLHTKIGGFTDVLLLYIYRAVSKNKLAIPPLDKSQLLIPPFGINRRPWTMGYFETVSHQPLDDSDVLSVHCFRDDTYVKTRYVDEFGKQLPRKYSPCGLFALGSYRTIDAGISLALGIKPHPDTITP